MHTQNKNSPIKRLSEQYLADKDIAKIISVSSSWVRKQRHLRNKGEEHTLPIDPVYIGTSPRYQASDFFTWLEGLK